MEGRKSREHSTDSPISEEYGCDRVLKAINLTTESVSNIYSIRSL